MGAKAKVNTNAKLRVEAKVKDHDLATDNPHGGKAGWRQGKGEGDNKGKAGGGDKGEGQ